MMIRTITGGVSALRRMASMALLLALVGPGGCDRSDEPRSSAPGDPSTGEGVGPAAEEGEGPTGPSETPVAITIDDLPWVGPLPPGWDRMDGTRRILAALERHGAQATGFVNCGRSQPGTPVLSAWLEAGHELGNHTEQHLDLNYADPASWAADAGTCDRSLRDLTGARSLTFRYPYLHRGPTAERYRAGRAAVDELGSVIAPVTINTGDWILDDPWVAALRSGDDEAAERIATGYVDHVARAAAHYRTVAGERVGRDVAHILLLHANALLADRLDAVLTRLREEGFRFVALEEALRDPVYALEDDYVGPEGLSWLYRIPPADPSAHAWDLEEAARVRALIP